MNNNYQNFQHSPLSNNPNMVSSNNNNSKKRKKDLTSELNPNKRPALSPSSDNLNQRSFNMISTNNNPLLKIVEEELSSISKLENEKSIVEIEICQLKNEVIKLREQNNCLELKLIEANQNSQLLNQDQSKLIAELEIHNKKLKSQLLTCLKLYDLEKKEKNNARSELFELKKTNNDLIVHLGELKRLPINSELSDFQNSLYDSAIDILKDENSKLKDENSKLKDENSNLNKESSVNIKIQNYLVAYSRQYFHMREAGLDAEADLFAQDTLLPYIKISVNTDHIRRFFQTSNLQTNHPFQPMQSPNSQPQLQPSSIINNNNFVASINNPQQSDNYHVNTPLTPMSEAIEELLYQPSTPADPNSKTLSDQLPESNE